MDPPGWGRGGQSVRAQSTTIGVVLLFGLILTGALTVVVLGATAIGDMQGTLSEQRAEKAMTQFDSKVALVALGNSDVQEVSFGTDRASNFETREGEGWMRVTRENQTSGTTKTIVNQSLGAITYEANGNTLAYQGGGVWKRTAGNESVMVSPPEFYFRNGTLTLPIINVTGAASLGSKASVNHEETIKWYPTAADKNPLTNHLVKVSVKSQYYKAWGQYFEDRTEGEVEYDHSRQIVNLTLVSPINKRKLTAATASLAASGAFEIHGAARSGCSSDGDTQNGGKEMYTNSYNSSQSGDYCSQAASGGYGHQGDIVYGENVNISDGSGGSWIHGDVDSGGNVTVSSSGGGKPSVYGHINYTDNCNPSITDCESRVENPSATVNQINGVEEERQIDYFVNNSIADIESDGNPAGGPIDSNDRLVFNASDQVELTGGKYFLEKIDFAGGSGDEIILNTTNGHIDLAVREHVTIPQNKEITVKGNGSVDMFVGNESGSTWAFAMAKESGVLNDGDDADQFRLYGKQDMNVRLGDGGGGGDPAKFVGVIYSPPGHDGNGTVKFNKGEVMGGVVTGTTIIANSGGSIHYDEKLKNKQIIDPDARILAITYLHISVNRIRVD